MTKNPIICALDTKDVAKAKLLTTSLHDSIWGVKLGLEYVMACGISAVEEITNLAVPVFLDMKFHDIPNTVAEAMRGIVRLNVAMVTVHAQGGRVMMEYAAAAAREEAAKQGIKPPKIIAVTMLTSMEESELPLIGVQGEKDSYINQLASLAKAADLDGVVCSAHEAAAIRAACGDDFLIVTPGIRAAGGKQHDQKRVATPKQAVDAGADYLVIGRAITEAKAPQEAAAQLLASI